MRVSSAAADVIVPAPSIPMSTIPQFHWKKAKDPPKLIRCMAIVGRDVNGPLVRDTRSSYAGRPFESGHLLESTNDISMQNIMIIQRITGRYPRALLLWHISLATPPRDTSKRHLQAPLKGHLEEVWTRVDKRIPVGHTAAQPAKSYQRPPYYGPPSNLAQRPTLRTSSSRERNDLAGIIKTC